jgi:protein TonB
VESGGILRTKAKYLSLISIVLNGSILAVLILLPIIHPNSLPEQALAMLLIAPSPPASPPRAARPAAAARTPARAALLISQVDPPSGITRPAIVAAEGPPSLDRNMIGSGEANDSIYFGNVANSVGKSSSPEAIAAIPKKLAISSGVMAGNKIAGNNPMYPAIAGAAHLQGTVVLQATISKTGAIEDLRVLSGPPMLLNAAFDAVKTWRYRPYLLNGEPVEVETTINVVFKLVD